MPKSQYSRPSKTKATALGDKGRTRWTRHLRKTVFTLFKPSEFITAEESAVNGRDKDPMGSRPVWASIRIRVDQMATIELLQARHLKVTAKEISRSEVLAALMAAGLKQTLEHAEFGGSS